MFKLGFLVESVGISQRSIYLAKSMNALVAQRPDISPVAFYRNYGKVVYEPEFAIMTAKEIWSFDGIAIATDIVSAKTLLRCPVPKHKFFYVWEMEWPYLNPFNYADIEDVYTSSQMPLIVRSQSHYDIINGLWQTPKKIIEEFQYEQFIELVEETSQKI